MAKKASKKKASKKKVAAKNVSHEKGSESVTEEVLVDAPEDPEQEPAPAPAIQEERTLKVVDKGRTTFYTQSEYDKKFGK